MTHLTGRTPKTDKIPELPSSVTRLEVIDETGKAYVRHGVSVELSCEIEMMEDGSLVFRVQGRPAN